MANQKKSSSKKTDISAALEYLRALEKDPAEKAAFNRAIQAAAKKESKRPGGEFSALFLSAIRIP